VRLRTIGTDSLPLGENRPRSHAELVRAELCTSRVAERGTATARSNKEEVLCHIHIVKEIARTSAPPESRFFVREPQGEALGPSYGAAIDRQLC
jgi:hypothetical protein